MLSGMDAISARAFEFSGDIARSTGATAFGTAGRIPRPGRHRIQASACGCRARRI